LTGANDLENRELIMLIRLYWLPLSSIRSEIEFRVFHDVFCEHYHIGVNEFAFDEYIQRIYEEILMDIVELQPVDWAIFIFFVFANWARNALDLGTSSCHHFESKSDELASCYADRTIELFTIIGKINFC